MRLNVPCVYLSIDTTNANSISNFTQLIPLIPLTLMISMIHYFCHSPLEAVVEFTEKRGNCENYIKEANYDIAVGHLLFKSFWANDPAFQLAICTCNLLSLFKIDFAWITGYRQQIKTIRLNSVFMVGKSSERQEVWFKVL
jgi:hypothetical protein